MYARKRVYRRKARQGPRRGYRTYRKSIIRKRQRPQGYKGIVSFKRTVQLSSISVAAAVQNLVYTFSLNSLPNASEITSLYDMYKIKCVVLKLVPLFTSSDTNPQATTYNVNPIHSVIDCTDQTALATLNDYMQYSTYKMTRGLAMHTRKVYPKFLDLVDDNGASVVGQVNKGWLRTDGSGGNIDHLGVKLHVPSNVASSQSVYEVFATYYIQCKNTK